MRGMLCAFTKMRDHSKPDWKNMKETTTDNPALQLLGRKNLTHNDNNLKILYLENKVIRLNN